jgi:hypothetical protein
MHAPMVSRGARPIWRPVLGEHGTLDGLVIPVQRKWAWTVPCQRSWASYCLKLPSVLSPRATGCRMHRRCAYNEHAPERSGRSKWHAWIAEIHRCIGGINAFQASA